MRKKNSVICLLFLIIVFVTLIGFSPVQAQISGFWTKPQIIPYYDDIYPPYLVADQNQVVHAFNSQRVGQDSIAILYRQWSYHTGWTQPNDILIPGNPSSSQSLQGAFLDQGGRFHLIYHNGLEGNATIQYTSAWAAEAVKSNAWSLPLDIGRAAHIPASAKLIGDGKELLMVVYSGDLEGLGLYETHSDDRGSTWSDPKLIQLVDNPDVFPFHIRHTIDPNGVVHIVWSWVNSMAFGEKVFYGSYDPITNKWSKPFLIASKEGNDYAADWATIIHYNDELILMYMDGIVPGGIPPTRWMRRSRDGGQTWFAPIAPFPQVGENGFAELLVDSNQELHIILANRVGNPEISGIWHGTWLGNSWSALELIGPSSPVELSSSGDDRDFARASRPNAIISQGNVLLATWWHDMVGSPSAAFSSRILDAPELPTIPLPAPSSINAPTASATEYIYSPSPTITPSSINVVDIKNPPLEFDINNPSDQILMAFIPVIFLLVVVVLVIRFKA